MSKLVNRFLTEYAAEKDLEKRLDLIIDFFNYYNYSHFTKISVLLKKEQKIFRDINHYDGLALIGIIFTYSFFEKGDFEKVEEELNRVLAIYDQINLPRIKSQILNFQAFLHSHQGNYDRAFEYCFASIKEGELDVNKKYNFWSHFTLGVFYFDLKDYPNAEKCFFEGINGFRKYDNQYGAARCETGLSSLYIEQGNYDKAEALLKNALNYYDGVGETPGKARSLTNLAVISRKKGELKDALDYFKQSLVMRKKVNHMQGIATSLNDIADVLLDLKAYKKAEKYLIESLRTSESIMNKAKLYRAHHLLSKLYRETNEPWKSLHHYDLYEQLKSEVVGEIANNKIKALQTRMLNEKSEQEKEIERLKNIELKRVFAVVEHQIKSITDSINYARRIQMGILPNETTLNTSLKDYFVLYRPKDIVSGDFYWCESVFSKYHNAHLDLVAVVDCTGHGVPGAFMSMLAYNLLNQALKEPSINFPADVLNYVTMELPRILKSQSESENINDGMDVALCVFDYANSKLFFSGARRPLWIVRNGKNEVEEIKASLNWIGGQVKQNQKFVNHEIRFNKGDTFYMFSDGFPDQFNELSNKKLTSRKFKSLILDIQSLSMKEQANYLDRFITNWRGSVEQIDDILVIGIRI